MRKKKVLFVCTHNSARSQMAEAWLNYLCGDFAVAESAGIEAGGLNPLAVRAMQEVGIDISHKHSKHVLDLFSSGHRYDVVVTVCDDETAEKCPLFPGLLTRLHWSFHDPSLFIGTEEEKLAEVRKVRDQIKAEVEAWKAQELAEMLEHGDATSPPA